MHGYDVLKKLRVAKVQTPVLILSGISEMDSKVRSFGFGADDYVTKPFHREELVARIHAVVRRSKGHSQSVIRTGKLAVNLDAKTVEVDGARVHLTGKEYAMLELLSLRKGTTLTKEMFLNHLYGGMDEPELKIIDVFICKLRKKLSQACDGENYIETVWGRGYVLREPEEVEASRGRLTIFPEGAKRAAVRKGDAAAFLSSAAGTSVCRRPRFLRPSSRAGRRARQQRIAVDDDEIGLHARREAPELGFGEAGIGGIAVNAHQACSRVTFSSRAPAAERLAIAHPAR